MLADDLALLSKSKEGLQNFCSEWQMNVNEKKQTNKSNDYYQKRKSVEN